MENRKIISILRAPGQQTQRIEKAFEYICEKFRVNKNKQLQLKQKLKNLDLKFRHLWEKANRHNERFEFVNKDFLDAQFNMEIFVEIEPEPSTSSGRGRPSKQFDVSSERSKRRKINDELIDPKVDSIEKALLVARRTAYNRRETSLVKVIGHILKNSDNAAKMFVTLKDSREMMSAEEAFEYFLDCDMTKYVYEQTHKKIPRGFLPIK